MDTLTSEDVSALEDVIEFYETIGAAHTAALIHHALTLAKSADEEPEVFFPNLQRLFELQSVN